MENVSKKIKKIIDEHPEMWEETTLKNGEILVETGNIVKQIFYIKSGRVRAFTNDFKNAKEVILNFFETNDTVVSYGSLMKEIPVRINIQAIEETKIYSISKENWKMVKKQKPEVNDLLLVLMTEYLTMALDFIAKTASRTVVERYLLAFEKFPFLSSCSDETVALYLGVSRRTIQNVKADLKIKNQKSK